jgi:hypothetical protein
MSAESTTIQESQPRSILPIFIGGLVMLGLFWGLNQLMRGWAPAEPDYETQRSDTRYQNLAALKQTNEQALTTYGWVNKERGIVRIPVERAIELVVPTLNAARPAPAYPIQQTVAPAPDATAPGAAPEPTTPSAPETATPTN